MRRILVFVLYFLIISISVVSGVQTRKFVEEYILRGYLSQLCVGLFNIFFLIISLFVFVFVCYKIEKKRTTRNNFFRSAQNLDDADDKDQDDDIDDEDDFGDDGGDWDEDTDPSFVPSRTKELALV